MDNLIIVDDEPLARNQLSTFIQWDDLNFRLAGCFQNGKEALEYIQKNDVQVVITDIKMPIMDGLELVKNCKDQFPDIFFIIISGFREFEYARSALLYGVKDYILKPIKHRELLGSLHNIRIQLDDRDKKSELYNTSFVQYHKHYILQKVFSDVLDHITTDQQTLISHLTAAGISQDLINNPCALYHVHISDFENYLLNIWKHKQKRLYNAIDNIIPFETELLYSFSAKYNYNKISIILLSKTPTDNFLDVANPLINNIIEMISENLKLGIKIDTYSNFQKLSDILTQSYQSNIYNDKIITQALQYIEQHISEPISSDVVAQYVNLNTSYFGTYFKKKMNINFLDYVTKQKIEKSKDLLKNEDTLISSIVDLVGYKSERHFYELFKKHTNMTPTQYRKSILE